MYYCIVQLMQSQDAMHGWVQSEQRSLQKIKMHLCIKSVSPRSSEQFAMEQVLLFRSPTVREYELICSQLSAPLRPNGQSPVYCRYIKIQENIYNVTLEKINVYEDTNCNVGIQERLWKFQVPIRIKRTKIENMARKSI